MSDNESSDDLELHALIAEYAAKEKLLELQEIQAKPSGAKVDTQNDTKEMELDKTVPMDKIIFGAKAEFVKNLAVAVKNNAGSENEDATVGKGKKRKPVWIDEEEEEVQVGDVKRRTKRTGPLGHLKMDKPYKEFLTKRFSRIMPEPKWASLDAKSENEDSDDEILRTVGFLTATSGTALPATRINVKQLKDLNRTTYCEGPITSIQFHPNSTAALVAGERGYATIYSIDGIRNDKLHSIRFRKFPLECVKITPNGTKAVFGSRRSYYYVYDLLTAREMRYTLQKQETLQNFNISPCGRYMAVAGRFGVLYLYDFNSQEIIHDFKQEDTVAGINFTADSQRIICSSDAHKVSIFSMRQRKTEHVFDDDGCIHGCSSDLSPNQRMFATGSREGIVNVYDFDKVFNSSTPKPEKTLYNLTTSISDLKFNHSSEMLGMCSEEVPAAVKLAHFPSGTVFANFPDFKSDVGNIGTIEFSPGSGYLALGNRKREARLFRLKHFMNY